MPAPEPNLEGLSPVTQILAFMGSLAVGVFMWLSSWWNKQTQSPGNLISQENDKLKGDIDESLSRFTEQLDKQITVQFKITNDAIDVLSGSHDKVSDRLRLLEMKVAGIEAILNTRTPRR